MIAFVAQQLGVSIRVDFADYAQRDQTRREHAVELQGYLGLRSFGLADWRACLRVGADAAWATDRGEPIVQAMLAHLRASSVLLPPATVLERIGLAARCARAKKIFEALADGLTDAERDTLARLLTVDPELRRSRFAWLRDYSESPAPSNIVALLDRLEYARGLGNRSRARRANPPRPPRPADRRRGDHDRPAHRRSRTRAANGDPRCPGGQPRDPAHRRDARHVREIHGHACSAGHGTGTSGVSRPPGAMSPGRWSCSAAPSPRSGTPRRPERTASPSSNARSAWSNSTTCCRSSGPSPTWRTRTSWSRRPSAIRCCAGSARASSPRSTSGRTRRTIPSWPPSIFSGRWIATAPARCPNGRRHRSCRRSGAS